MAKHDIGPVGEIAPGQGKAYNVAGTFVVVYRLSDGYYATQARCPHMMGPLARGKILDDRLVQCPLHHARFDIRSGQVVDWANFPPGIQVLNIVRREKALSIYPVSEENGRIYVDI